MTIETRRVTALSGSLSFVAGYVDTVGFVALFGLFTAHVTGNFVLIGSVLAHSSGSVLLKLLVFPAFIAAVALTRVLTLQLERRGLPTLRAVLVVQSVLLIGFAVCGYSASPIESAEAPLAMLAGILGAAAMGVQNASSRLVFSDLAPTTVMTGNVTQLVIDAVDLARGAANDAVRQRAARFVLPITAFGLGAISGAFGYVYFGFIALALPVGLLGAMAYWIQRPLPAAGAPVAPT